MLVNKSYGSIPTSNFMVQLSFLLLDPKLIGLEALSGGLRKIGQLTSTFG